MGWGSAGFVTSVFTYFPSLILRKGWGIFPFPKYTETLKGGLGHLHVERLHYCVSEQLKTETMLDIQSISENFEYFSFY